MIERATLLCGRWGEAVPGKTEFQCCHFESSRRWPLTPTSPGIAGIGFALKKLLAPGDCSGHCRRRPLGSQVYRRLGSSRRLAWSGTSRAGETLRGYSVGEEVQPRKHRQTSKTTLQMKLNGMPIYIYSHTDTQAGQIQDLTRISTSYASPCRSASHHNQEPFLL
eukprot:GHVT01048408.1.p2 GENE.GHVT01048408.1~~GHVT01048408.1.p2  ORF type:complete len:165 (+),score=6.31 GHVT01048408.1:1178-1672(+)